MTRWLWLGVLLLVGSAGAEEGEELDADLVDREPTNCVTVNRIRRTDIINDNNILFYMNGGKIYRNYLPRKCPRLEREDAFTYDVRTNSLCNVDVIYVLERFGGSLRRGPGCGLGMFYEISEEEAERLKKPMDDRIEVEEPEPVDEDPVE